MAEIEQPPITIKGLVDGEEITAVIDAAHPAYEAIRSMRGGDYSIGGIPVTPLDFETDTDIGRVLRHAVAPGTWQPQPDSDILADLRAAVEKMRTEPVVVPSPHQHLFVNYGCIQCGAAPPLEGL